MNPYRRRVFGLLEPLLRPAAPYARVLDFGAGDGWFADRMEGEGIAREVVALDVMPRKKAVRETVLHGGGPLPFADRAFDLVYAVDVLHHCANPREALAELARCAGSDLVLKDHTAAGGRDRALLWALDELGNRRFGVPSPRRYQARFEWFGWIEAQGFRLRTLVHPARCHVGPLGLLTNHLQFVALWSRG